MLSFIKEFFNLIHSRRKFWLYPIFIAFIIFVFLFFLIQGSPVAPFIYALF